MSFGVKHLGPACLLSLGFLFLAGPPGTMASGAGGPAGKTPTAADVHDLPPPFRAELRRAAMQGIEAGLHLSEDGSAYTYVRPCPSAKGGESATYSATLSCDPSRGIEVTAGNSEYSVKLVPLIPSLREIRPEGDILAYSTPDERVRLVYRFKRNGLKEDIVLSRPPSSDWTVSFRMPLDPALEAKRDAKGNVLVYGPDSVLSGFIQAGDEASARLVMKARRAAPKTNLLYIIPAPVVTDGDGRVRGGAYFTLNAGSLDLHVPGAEGWPAPLTVDPSIVVSTTAAFEAGNNEGMISFDTDAISRAAPSNGVLGDWEAATSFSTARYEQASVACNGYLYVLGGWGGGFLNDVQYAPIGSDGTLGAWTATSSFATGRQAPASVAYDGYLYVIGGRSGSGMLSDVQYAPINADGTLGVWTATTSFATGRFGHASVAYDGYLYVMGGDPSSMSPLNDVQVAPLHADGTVGAWSATTAFPTARVFHASVAYNGHLYVIGGHGSGTTLLDDVQVAPIGSDGSVGAWSATASFSTPRTLLASAACSGHLYVIGGNNGSKALGDVQCAPILENGQVGPWISTAALPSGRWGHAAAAWDGHLYVCGGEGESSTYLNDVQVAPIASGSSDWTWSATASFATARSGHAAAAYNGFLYVLGGFNTTTGRLNDVQYAPLHDDGTLGAWAATSSFSIPRSALTSAAANGYLYVIGGLSASGGLKDVEYAPINSDGTVGTWSTTTFLPSVRWGHASLVYNGYLYSIGGTAGVGSYLTDVLFASVNSDGTLGSWTSTSSFTTGRCYHASVASGGYLYVLGGTNGISSYLADVQVAPINSNGTVGTWAATTSFPTAREGLASVACKGCLFVLGGRGSGGVLNDVEYASIQSDGTLGSWYPQVGFPTARDYHAALACNGYIYVMGGSVGTSELSDVQMALVGADGTVSAWSAAASFTTARYRHASVAYKGYLYVIGGDNSSTFFSDVQFAPISSDGTVGAWATTTSLPFGRWGHASVAYDGYLYVLGGFNNAHGNFLNDVLFAPVLSDGTLGDWTSTAGFTTGRYGHTSVAYKGFLYVIGGLSNGSYLNNVQYAPLHSDGTVGTWTDAAHFNYGREFHTSAAYNGYLYVIGGDTGSSFFSDVQYAPIQSDGSVGAWNATASFATGRSGHGSAASDGYLYVIAGGAAGYLNDVQYAPILSDGTVGPWESTTSYPDAVFHHASVAYGGYLYGTGGRDSGGYRDSVWVAQLNTPAPLGAYSKLLDLGGDQVMESLQFDSTPGRAGAVNLTYAVAPQSSAVFGARTTIADASSGTSYTAGLGCGRWLWVHFDLDDRHSATTDSGGALGRTDVLDFSLTYDSLSGVGNSLDAAKTTAVHLTWAAVPAATSYNVSRCDATTGHCTPAFLGNTAGLYWDDGVLGDSRLYWYTVQAVNGECVSP